jgi:hemolysin activation/secretion protein
MHTKKIVLCISLFLFFLSSFAFAQDPGKAAQVSSSELQIEKERALRARIEALKEREVEEDELIEEDEIAEDSEAVMITDITVTGVSQFSSGQIAEIITPYKNKELTLREMGKIATRITELYRSNGFITSRAYLPPQKIATGVLEIRVIEGKTGEVSVSGNRFFRAKRIRSSLSMKNGEIFNHALLRRNLTRINEMPDRNVKALLAPGEEPGTTDIALEVKDRFPIHAKVGWDNWGSRYIRKNHYTGVITDNNLLGFDDILTAQYQFGDSHDYRLLSLRYLFPFTSTVRVGALYSRSEIELGREYTDVMARSKGKMMSLYSMYDFYTTDNINATLNLGFDYKDNFNFQLGDEESRDRMRVVKLGFDIDVLDEWNGRTIISPEIDTGIPRFMGGLDTNDPKASRQGSGGRFVKGTLMLVRLQKMPYDTSLLLKNQFQFTPHVLTATEQFQLGGIANNRGYASGERVGDEGGATTLELSVPVYGIPEDLMFPFLNKSIYDALRLVAFYDVGYVHLRKPQPGEDSVSALNSAGWGVRFNLPSNFTFSADFGCPLGGSKPQDGSHLRTWLSISMQF